MPPPQPLYSSPIKHTSLTPQPSSSSQHQRPASQPKPSYIDLSLERDASPKDANGQSVTRRAFFCDVVLEGVARGGPRGRETEAFLFTLGTQITSVPYPPSSATPSMPNGRPITPGRIARSESTDGLGGNYPTPNPKKLQSLLEELVSTERTYFRRLTALKQTYADPLRLFSRDPSMCIIPLYSANALFGNIDVLVDVNEAFLADLERCVASFGGGGVQDGRRGGGGGGGEQQLLGVGDVALKHFRELKAFDCYRLYYDKTEDAQNMFNDLINKKKGFADFVQASKYKTEGVNNVGLRELLMEPIQRIPRYTMIWQLMMKSMSMEDPQRAKLAEATEIASAIATCEKDPMTKRMIIFSGLQRTMEGFPASLINNNRDYHDSLDAEDLPPALNSTSSHSHEPASSFPSSSSNPNIPPQHASSAASSLHCTLLLFSDTLLISKRPSASQSGRKLTGLDDVPKLWRGSMTVAPGMGSRSGSSHGGSTSGGGGPGANGGEGSGKLSCRGIVSLLDVVASDLGGGDFHLHLSRPPTSSVSASDRWSSRYSRSFAVVHPPAPLAHHSSDPNLVLSRQDKHRFVHNLWAAQSLLRTRGGRSQAFVGLDEERLEGWGRGNGRARGFWNVFEGREGWEGEGGKAKVVVHVDESGRFGQESLLGREETRPHLVVEVQPLTGGLSRVTVRSRDHSEEAEILPTTEVTSKILQTVHQHGIYQPRSDSRSGPNTPSYAVTKGRGPMLGLDAISRNLFGGSSLSSRNGTSSSTSHKRSRSANSKASTMSSSITQSTVSSLGRSSDDGAGGMRCDRRSPGPCSSGGEQEDGEGRGGERARASRSASPYQEKEREKRLSQRKPVPREEMNDSEWDLSQKLELARKNSVVAGESSRGVRREKSQDVLMRDRQPSISEETSPDLAPTPPSPDIVLPPSPQHPQYVSTSPLRVRNKTPSTEKPAFFEIPPLEEDPSFAESFYQQTTSTISTTARTPISPPLPPLPPAERVLSSVEQAKSPTQTLNRSLSTTKRPMGPRGPASASTSAFASTSAAVGPTVTSPVASTSSLTHAHTHQRQPSSIPIPSSRRMTQQAALGVASTAPPGSAHAKNRLLSTESSGSKRRVSDDWKRARPSAAANIISPSYQRHPSNSSSPHVGGAPISPSDGTPLSPSSSLLQKRDRAQTTESDEANVAAEDGQQREQLHGLGLGQQQGKKPKMEMSEAEVQEKMKSPLRHASRTGLPLVLVERENGRARQPSGGGGAHGSRKASLGTGGSKRMLHTEEDLEAMNVEERAIALACGLKDESASSRKSVKQIRLEAEGLRTHFSNDLASKDRVHRMTGENGSLPRSPQSRHIAKRADDSRMGRLDEAFGGLPSSSSAESSSSKRSATPGLNIAFLDDWCSHLEKLINDLDVDLQRSVRYSEMLREDVSTLAEKTKNSAEISSLQSQLAQANEELQQARRIFDEQRLELVDAKNENSALYEAFNEELEQMYADTTLPGAEAHVAMKRDIQMTKADRNALRLENATLKRELDQALYEKERHEQLLRQHGLL